MKHFFYKIYADCGMASSMAISYKNTRKIREKKELHKVHLILLAAVYGAEMLAIVVQMRVHAVVATDGRNRVVIDTVVEVELCPATHEIGI